MSRKNITLYVSLNGDDGWSGRYPDTFNNDGPFRTVERAMQEVRKFKSRQNGESSAPPLKVCLRGGTYRIEEPVVLGPGDSGTHNCPVTWQAYKSEKVVLSGAKRIGALKKIAKHGRTFWTSYDIGSASFDHLWINGQRRYRSRYPEKGFLIYRRSHEKLLQDERNIAWIEEDVLKEVADEKSLTFVFMHKWVDLNLPVEHIDRKKGCVKFKKSSRRPMEDTHWSAPEIPGFARYYIDNVFSRIQEGQWYIDEDERCLYYLPLPGEDIDKTEILYPALKHILILKGEPDKKRFVENIHFRNIVFSHTFWELDDKDAGDLQAAIKVKGAIYGQGVRNCSFTDCEVSRTGNYGIELSGGCRNNLISGCDLFDLGAGGIKIGATGKTNRPGPENPFHNRAFQSGNNTVKNCRIYDGGNAYFQAVGIWIGHSSRNIISRNHIHDFYYSGISVGWVWGYGKSLSHDNIVEYNNVHHIGAKQETSNPVGRGPLLSDMGGIYTLGTQKGTVIRYNIFRDIRACSYGGWGIYLDEGSTGIKVENNLVYNTTHGGFHLHYGKNNIVRNNIFAFGRDSQVTKSLAEEHTGFRFEKNIVYFNSGALFSGDFSNFNIVSDKNIYCHVLKEKPECLNTVFNKSLNLTKITKIPFDNWQAEGLDRNSVIGRPLFADPETGNFRLRRSSITAEIGFVPFWQKLYRPGYKASGNKKDK